jgi:chromosome partitioning protein
MTEVLAVVNQKGGVGKTTTSVNLGSYLAYAGKPTLIVDLDPQANATAGLGIKQEEGAPTLYEVLIGQITAEQAVRPTTQKNLNVITSSTDLAGAAMELMDQPMREYRLRKAMKSLAKYYQFILIDCPPSLGLLTINGLVAADRLIIPVQCEFYALEGLSQLLQTVELVRQHLNPKLQVLGALLTMYDRRTALNRKVAREVRKTFPGHVFASIIPRNTELAEAPSTGRTILDYAKHSSGARAYEYLAEELLHLYS